MQDWIKFKRPNKFHWFLIHWNIGACKILKADFQAVLAFPYCSVSSLWYLWLLWDWRILESSQLVFLHCAHGKYGVVFSMFNVLFESRLLTWTRSEVTDDKASEQIKNKLFQHCGNLFLFCFFTLCCLIRNIFFMHISIFFFFCLFLQNNYFCFLFNTNWNLVACWRFYGWNQFILDIKCM